MDWLFLWDVCTAMHFPDKVIQWIKQCVFTVTFSISMNGFLEGHFQGKKGLRQGDPISPYLFLLIMGAFSSLLRNNIQNNAFQYHPKCEKTQVSRLYFADNLFLLPTANVESVQVLKATMEEFGLMSGLVPNLQKNSVFIDGTSVQAKEEICSIMGMNAKELPVKYLGVPLISISLKYGDCEDLKNKIMGKVLSWHAKLLAYAGRIQLIISVLSSIHTY